MKYWHTHFWVGHTHTNMRAHTQNYRNGYVFEWPKQVWVSTPLCFCHGFWALIQIYYEILGFLQSFQTLSKKNSLPFWIVCHPLFCKLSTASFLNKKIETQYVQTPIINYMKPAPSTCRHCVRWNAPPPSGPVASVLSAGHRKWLGRGKHYPKVDLEQKTTRTPTVQQHTGLEVLEVTFLEDTPPPCPCPVVSL